MAEKTLPNADNVPQTGDRSLVKNFSCFNTPFFPSGNISNHSSSAGL